MLFAERLNHTAINGRKRHLHLVDGTIETIQWHMSGTIEIAIID